MNTDLCTLRHVSIHGHVDTNRRTLAAFLLNSGIMDSPQVLVGPIASACPADAGDVGGLQLAADAGDAATAQLVDSFETPTKRSRKRLTFTPEIGYGLYCGDFRVPTQRVEGEDFFKVAPYASPCCNAWWLRPCGLGRVKDLPRKNVFRDIHDMLLNTRGKRKRFVHKVFGMSTKVSSSSGSP